MAQVNDLNMRLDISSGHLEKARETNMALESTILAEGVLWPRKTVRSRH